MPDLAYINHNNKIVPIEEAKISILDRGFLFADAVYEVLRVYRGVPFYLQEHLMRLSRNLQTLEIPFSKSEKIPAVISKLIQQSSYLEARIYMQVSRGAAKRQLVFPKYPQPTLVMFIEQVNLTQIRQLQKSGVKLVSLQDTRWRRCDLKTTGLLPNVLAQQWASRTNAFDALFVDQSGVVRETTHASFFIILAGSLIVPPAGDYLLPGITRNIVLHLVDKMNIPVSIRPINLKEIFQAQEAFITATTAEIIPVTHVDDFGIPKVASALQKKAMRQFIPITRQLQVAYRQHVKQWLQKNAP